MNELKSLLAALGGHSRRSHAKSYEEGRDLLAKACTMIAEKYEIEMICCSTRDDVDNHQMFMHASPPVVAMFIHTLLTDKKYNVAKVLKNKHWKEILGNRFSPFQKSFYIVMGMGLWALVSNILPMIVHMIIVQYRGF